MKSRGDRVTLWCEWRWVLWCSTCTGSEEQNGIYIIRLWSTNSQSVNHPTKLAWFTNKITYPQRARFFFSYEIWYCPVNSDSWYFRWPASVGSSGALSQNMLSSATLWHRLVQLSASVDLCFAFFWKGSKQRSPITGSFVQSTKASRDWKDRKSESTRGKRPLIRWSMRCFHLTSKASWGVQPEFWLSRRSFSGWSEARDVPRFLLESFPCCFQQKVQTIVLSPSLAQHVNGYFFSPILCILPSFPRPLQHSFLLVALFCTQRPVVFMWKKLGSFAPFLFVERCVLGISMATHIGGHANPAFRLCGFWHHVFVLLLSDVERLWLNHATTNLIREANRISVCRSSVSLGIWIMRKERFNHKSVRTAINNYEKKKKLPNCVLQRCTSVKNLQYFIYWVLAVIV